MCKRRKVTERHHRQFVSNNVQEHSFTLQEERDNNVEQNQRWNRAFEINEKTPTTATKTKTLITFRWAISAVWKTAQPHWNSTLTRLKHHHSSSGSWSVSSWCFFLFFLHKPLTLLHPSYFPSRSIDIAKIGFLHFPLSTVSCVLCCSSSRSFQTNFPQSYPVIFGIFGNSGTLKKKKKKIVWVVWLHSANFTNVEGL